MTSVPNVLAINGSYREDGITDHAVEAALAAAADAGAEIEHIRLRNYPIEFCLNCRACTQKPGDAPGECVHDDRMSELVQKIEKADAYVLAAPTNYGSATAIFKRFMERLTVYAYWPWGALAPVYRKAKGPQKKVLMLSSSAAPGIFGRFLYKSRSQLKLAARAIGAKPIGTVFTGMISSTADAPLPDHQRDKIKSMASELV
ncbi:MAG: flavodoxin family protein [Woeseiaceae bacterium]